MSTQDSRKLSDPESPRGEITKAVLDEGSQSNAHLDVFKTRHHVDIAKDSLVWNDTWKLCPTRDAILREASQALEKDLGEMISVDVLTGCCCIIGVR